MGVQSTTPANLVIGAPGTFLVDNVDVGATEGNVVFRVAQTKFIPVLNGVKTNLIGTFFVQEEHAEMEVGLPEVSATIVGLLAPGAVSATLALTVQGSPAWTATTIAADAVAFQQTGIKVAAVTGMVVGQYAGITGPPLQVRQITRVGTLGAGGTGIDLSDPLSTAVATGKAITQYTGDGGTQYQSGVLANRRLASSAYHTIEARLGGLNGLRYVFGLRGAINDGPAEFTLGDAALMSPRPRFRSTLDPANMATTDWYTTRIPADV